jgi:hypothetical protein
VKTPRAWTSLALLLFPIFTATALPAGCSKEKPAWCGKLAPVSLEGTASEQGARLGKALGELGIPATDPVSTQLGTVLKNIEKETKKPFGPALAKQLTDELQAASAAFSKVVAFDCQEGPTRWEAETKRISETLAKEAADNEKKKQEADAQKQAEEKKGAEERTASIEKCKQAAIARPSVPIDPKHYGKGAGTTRGGLVFVRQEGGSWKADAFQPSDEPGAVASQIDVVLRRPSSACKQMPDTDDKGRSFKVKVCGWQVDVVTCDLRTQTLLGSKRINLEVPEELGVRGSVKASADRNLAQQLWTRIDKMGW